MDRRTAPCTAPETGYLWLNYMTDSMTVQLLRHMHAHCQDADIRDIQLQVRQLAEERLTRTAKLLEDEQAALPNGFTQQDVNVNAPRLFSDDFTLLLLYHMTNRSLVVCAKALAMVVQPGVHDYFTACMRDTVEIGTRTKAHLLSKGLLSAPPFLHASAGARPEQRESFLQGYFGRGRTMNALEIANAFHNIQMNTVVRTVMLGYAQTAQLPEVRKLLAKAVHRTKDEAEAFRKKLEEEQLSVTPLSDSFVTDSKEPPYTDKLMMFHASLVNGSSIEQYGFGMASSIRSDLGAAYEKMMSSILHFADDGARLMIDRRWLEMMPSAADRRELQKV
ncbi:DUF3231 family protein [Paenibacillus chartarius]|uniref:DUF3231 family protein n=1 Tax=Paenibacillus chartarius TaxID=747481 RepID=A0ABV6DFN5_9BACL